MELTEKIIEKIGEMMATHLIDHLNDIEKSFDENDEKIDINLKLKIANIKGKLKIKTSIGFISNKIKDESVIYYDPAQNEFDFTFPNADGENPD